MKQKIGINFSSRNRPDTLRICLNQIFKYLSPENYDYVISVVIDSGDTIWDDQYSALILDFQTVIWYRATERLGIAKVKNHGLKILKENNCDHFFLFDDDAFSIKYGWEELYITTAIQNGVHHLMHQFPLPTGFEIIRSENGICEYSQSCGVLLYFTRQ